METNSSGSVSLSSNPSPAASQNILFCRENTEVTNPPTNYSAHLDRDLTVTVAKASRVTTLFLSVYAAVAK
jgi:hypothetical protein